MPPEIWYLGLLLIAAGAAAIVPAVRKWDREAPSETRPEPRRPVARSGTAAAEAVKATRPKAAPTTAPTGPGRPTKVAPKPGAKPAKAPTAPPAPEVRVRPPAPQPEVAEPAPEPVAVEEPAVVEEPVAVEEPVLVEEPVEVVEEPVEVAAEPVIVEERVEVLERPAPTAGRMARLRARLAKSQNVFGRGLLALLARDRLDEETWEEIEDTLISADVGVEATTEIVDRLRERARVLGTSDAAELRQMLADELLEALDPAADRSLRATPTGDRPAVLLVVGVNGSGKTTTCGKIARVLVADGHSVLLGAADTFRAAAADQLATWASRVGAEVVRGPEKGDPAAVAFDAVRRGIETGVDTVVIDTAGRLQNKVGLMDELGKVKRVVEKHGPVDETLLVLDATTGQNGLEQARVFTEVVNVTGVVLTKLDGTAKGGIVIAVQRKLGIPVKLVGLGEGPDDLAPFEPKVFVDALLAQ
jgi:fused signal recognition particle receptor